MTFTKLYNEADNHHLSAYAIYADGDALFFDPECENELSNEDTIAFCKLYPQNRLFVIDYNSGSGLMPVVYTDAESGIVRVLKTTDSAVSLKAYGAVPG